MTVTKAVSGNAVKNDGGSVVTTGTSTGLNSIGMDKLGSPIVRTITKDDAAADKARSAASFNYAGDLPISHYSTTLGGISASGLILGNFVTAGNSAKDSYGERLNITSISASGVPTYGVNSGVNVQVSGINNVLGKAADHAINAGEFNYGLGSIGTGVVNADY